MSNEPELLATKRAEKEGNSGAWSPEDVLREALRRIESGEWSPNRIMVLMTDESGCFEGIRSRTTHESTIAMLEVAKWDAIREWQEE